MAAVRDSHGRTKPSCWLPHGKVWHGLWFPPDSLSPLMDWARLVDRFSNTPHFVKLVVHGPSSQKFGLVDLQAWKWSRIQRNADWARVKLRLALPISRPNLKSLQGSYLQWQSFAWWCYSLIHHSFELLDSMPFRVRGVSVLYNSVLWAHGPIEELIFGIFTS